MRRRWSSSVLEFFTLATMVAFAAFIVVSILTIMTNIAQFKLHG